MTEEETFTSPGDFKKLIEDQKTLLDKKADEAEAMYEAEMEAEEQARADAEAQAEYEASQCYYHGEY